MREGVFGFMDEDIAKWKAAVEDLQDQLREETAKRRELERRCNLLEKLAHRDPSTGLRTETYLRTRVQEEIERAVRYPAAASLVTVCAPKEHMDTVPALGRRLSEEVRSSDQVFLLGKAGLAVLLIETPEEGARHVINRLSVELEQMVGGYGYTLTSFPVDTNLADEFLRLAMERHHEIANRMGSNGGMANSTNSHPLH